MRLAFVSVGKEGLNLSFDGETGSINKHVRLHTPQRLTARNEDEKVAYILENCVRAMREARRDELYAIHGDDWRVHEEVRAGGFWSAPDSDAERAMLEAAAKELLSHG